MAFFNDEDLLSERVKLNRNGERAIPWAALAIPTDVTAATLDATNSGTAVAGAGADSADRLSLRSDREGGNANRTNLPPWRVFLPLLESGPSRCVLNGSLFVGPSRQRVEFVSEDANASDESTRRSRWNRILAARLLKELSDLSFDLPDIAAQLLEEDPAMFLELFPLAPKSARGSSPFTAAALESASSQIWKIRVPDLWGKQVDLLLDDDADTVEGVAETLLRYKDRFRSLESAKRHFLRWPLWDALRARDAKGCHKPGRDIPRAILGFVEAPRPEDLTDLLKRWRPNPDELDRHWAFLDLEGKPLRFEKEKLFVVSRDNRAEDAMALLRELRLVDDSVVFVQQDEGVPALVGEKLLGRPENVVEAGPEAVFDILRRSSEARHHDLSRLKQAIQLEPLLKLLKARNELPAGLPLGFLVRTAAKKEERRKFGCLFLPPDGTASKEAMALWSVWIQRIFAEVDPTFVEPLRRLLVAFPNAREALRQLPRGDDLGCRLLESSRGEETFGQLHLLRLSHPADFSRLGELLTSARPDDRKLLAAELLSLAMESWHAWSEEERITFCALPIHHASDSSEGLRALLEATGGSLAGVREAFRLQSNEPNLPDAPVNLPSYALLNPMPRFRRFYEGDEYLALKAHDGRQLLLDVLEVSLSENSQRERERERVLAFVVERFPEELRRASDEPQRQEELKRALAGAALAPCLDGDWRRLSEVAFVSRAAVELPEAGREDLLAKLFDGQPVALPAREDELQQLVRAGGDAVRPIETFNRHELPRRAITSPSPELDLRSRVSLLLSHPLDSGGPPPAPAPAVAELKLRCCDGAEHALRECLLGRLPVLSNELAQQIAPRWVTPESAAEQLGVPEARVEELLQRLGVSKASTRTLDEGILERFRDHWTVLRATPVRLELLALVAGSSDRAPTRVDTVRSILGQLETVLVGLKPGRWVRPNDAIAPSWAATKPPLPDVTLLASKDWKLRTDGEKLALLRLWDDLCGVGDVSELLTRVLHIKPTKPWVERELYPWLERMLTAQPVPSWLVDPESGASERPTRLVAALQGASWVWASCGTEEKFRSPSQVLRSDIGLLRRVFWMPAAALPAAMAKAAEEFGFLTLASRELRLDAPLIDSLVEALADVRVSLGLSDGAKLYGWLAERLEKDPPLAKQWRATTLDRAAYRNFRKQGPGCSSARELFLGGERGERRFWDDLGENLLCLGPLDGNTASSDLRASYRKLEIHYAPTVEQVFFAIARLGGQSSATGGEAFSQLTLALKDLLALLSESERSEVMRLHASKFVVPTRGGTFEPLGDVLDAGAWRNAFCEEGVRGVLTDDPKDRKALEILHGLRLPRPKDLAAIAQLTGVRSERLDDQNPLGPWKDWVEEVRDPRTQRYESTVKFLPGLAVHPGLKLELCRTLATTWTRSGTTVQTTLRAAGDSPLCAFDLRSSTLKAYVPEQMLNVEQAALRRLDESIASELVRALGGDAPAVEALLKTVERPSIRLKLLHDQYASNCLFYYKDQVADLDFADEYRRWEGMKKGEPKEAARDLLITAVGSKFVKHRREQIAALGYTESSVFAELVQNAEDAYHQLERLALTPPEGSPPKVAFLLEGSALVIEHDGRRFNQSTNGNVREPAFENDVEGVLRTSGSYKKPLEPNVDDNKASGTIGRFGLGFKSVFLLTEAPEIHSGDWHFRIESGNLPKELPKPVDLPHPRTRIRLPLRDPAAFNGSREKFIRRLGELLVFLRRITQLTWSETDGDSPITADFVTKETPLPASRESTAVALAVVSDLRLTRWEGPAAQRVEIRLLRARSTQDGNAAQLAMLLDPDGAPVAWRHAFTSDLFLALPLQTKLGCGIAVSHRFEVQSGRTHLVESPHNVDRFAELATLLPVLAEGVRSAGGSERLCHRLDAFWDVWKWVDAGDASTEPLRKELAMDLVKLANLDACRVVPTRDPEHATSLKEQRFVLTGVSDGFGGDVLARSHRLPDAKVPLTPQTVVTNRFVAAYRAAGRCSGEQLATTLRSVDLQEIVESLVARQLFEKDSALFASLAVSLQNDDQRRESIGKVLESCRLASVDGTNKARGSAEPGALLALGSTKGDLELLPERLLWLPEAALRAPPTLKLLKAAGAHERPTSPMIAGWLPGATPATGSQLATFEECMGLLRYLLAGQRYRDLRSLDERIREAWLIDTAGRRMLLTPRQAFDQDLLPKDVLTDPTFRAWLGLPSEDREFLPPPAPPAVVNGKEALTRLVAWWRGPDGEIWLSKYERALYGDSGPMDATRFTSRLETPEQREPWMRLLLLGALHRMGRTTRDQHGAFLRLCEKSGWLRIFADQRRDADAWLGVLEQHIDSSGDLGGEFSEWMGNFVSIYLLSKSLDSTATAFRAVTQLSPGARVRMRDLTNPRGSSIFQGGGPDGPSVVRALGIGAHFVLRELVRAGHLKQSQLTPHCFVPAGSVLTLLEERFGIDLREAKTNPEVRAEQSEEIHRFLAATLGPEGATLGGGFDLPLLALSTDVELQRKLLR